MFNIAFAPAAVDVPPSATPMGANVPEPGSDGPRGSKESGDNGTGRSAPPYDEYGDDPSASGAKKKRGRRRRKAGKPRSSQKVEPVSLPASPTSTATSRAGSNASSSRHSSRSNGNGRGKGTRSRRTGSGNAAGNGNGNGGPGGHSKVATSRMPQTGSGFSAGGPTSKKQHDAPMTKRDLYFSLTTKVVQRAAEGPDGAPSLNNMFRVTIVNWENQIVLNALVLSDGVSLSPRPPVSATKKLSTPTPMSFTQARNEVEKTLRGKILIGYDLETHLKALRLTHPWSDVRDAATYARLGGSSVSTSPRSLRDLSYAVLKRELKFESGPDCDLLPICVTALDLYKSLRKEWEQDLVHIAKEKEAQQIEQLQQHQQRMVSQRQKMMADHYYHVQHQQQSDVGSPRDVPHQSQFYRHPYVSHQHMLEVSSQLSSQMSSQRSRSSSVDGLQQTYSPHHSMPIRDGLPSGLNGYRQQPQLPSMQTRAQNQPPQQTNSSKSWFRRSNKQRPSQLSPSLEASLLSNQSLSAQAMQALSGPEIHSSMTMHSYVGATSSAYDSSSQFGGSTEYESHYSESIASESVTSNDVMVSSSPFPFSQQQDLGTGLSLMHEQPSRSGNSSWFPFGSRKSRLTGQPSATGNESPPLGAVEESVDENREESGFMTSSSDHNRPLSHKSSSRGSISGLDDPSTKRSEGVTKSWFGFRKSKSPAASKHLMTSDDVLNDTTGATPADMPPLPFPGASDHKEVSVQSSAHGSSGSGSFQDGKISGLGKSQKDDRERSSWFNFRRSKSPASSKASRPTVKFSQAELLSTGTLPTLPTQVTDADDDWMHEVIQTDSALPRGDRALSEDLSLAGITSLSGVADINDFAPPTRTFDEEAKPVLLEEGENEPLAKDEHKESEANKATSSSLSWFKFMRSKGSSRQISHPENASSEIDPANGDEAFANDLLERLTNPASSFDEKCDEVEGKKEHHGWFEDVASAAPLDAACIGSSGWFGYPSVTEDIPSISPSLPQLTGGSQSLLKASQEPPPSPEALDCRTRGDTDSVTLSDEDNGITEFVYGFEKSLSFLQE